MSKDSESGVAATLLVMALVIVLLIGFVGWRVIGKKNKPTSNVAKEKIVIANIGEYSIFNLIAKEKGIFERNGLDAEVKEFTSGPSSVADLIAGKADFAIAADFVGVSQIFKKQDIRILSQASEHDVFSVVARKESGINQPGDIKGKKVGVTKNGAGEFFLGRFLIFNDLKLSDISLSDLPPAAMIKQIESGELDAVVIFEPHTYNFKKNSSDKYNIFSAQGQEKTRAIVYTMAKTVNTRPDVVKRYMRSLTEAENFYKSNPDEAKVILAKSMGYQMDYVDYLWPKIDFSLSLSQELLLTLENEARYAINNGVTTEKVIPNYLNYIHFDALNEVKPEAVTIVH